MNAYHISSTIGGTAGRDVPVIAGTLEATHWQTLIDDIHYASSIEPAEGEAGYRDIWVIEINRWENRAYGRTHERLAMTAENK